MSVNVKDQILTLSAYSPGKTTDEVKREFGLTNIVKLASNENPHGSSPVVQQAISEISNFAIYPDGVATHLRAAVAEFTGVNEDQLVFSSGLDELIQMLSRALLSEGTNTVMADVTFSQYSHHAVIEKAEVRQVPLKNGVHDLDAMAKQIDDETKIVWICNPNNPTGTYVNTNQVEDFLKAVPAHVLVVMDEAYFEYATAEDFPDTIPLLDQYDNLLVMRTFSKAYGLAAFRVGYGMGSASLIKQLDIVRLPFNTSVLGQVAAIAALKDPQFVKDCVEANRTELQRYYDFCENHQIHYFPSEGNFIYMNIPGRTSEEVFQHLLRKGFIVRSFPEGIRITIGTKEENDQLLQELENFMLVAK